MAVDNDENAVENSRIEDKYSRPIPASDGGAQDEDRRDAATIKRENFLNIY